MNLKDVIKYIECNQLNLINSNEVEMVYSDILEKLEQIEFMDLKDVRLVSELSKQYKIPMRTLNARINKAIENGMLIEFQDYRKSEGKRGTYILTKEGIEKIIGGSK